MPHATMSGVTVEGGRDAVLDAVDARVDSRVARRIGRGLRACTGT